MNKKVIFTLALIVFVALFVTTCRPVSYFPDEGKWYCKELEMQLDFSSDGDCFIVQNGEKIRCAFVNHRGSDFLSVGCQEYDSVYFALGEEILSVKLINLNVSELIVEDTDSGKTYTFLRVS